MADEAGAAPTEIERITEELKERFENARAAGAYADDLSDVELPKPGEESGAPSIARGFDLTAPGPRVRFRPELGFSSKPVVGPAITQVKRLLLRLQLYVFDDLARQADAAITRVENALAVEIETRERLEREVRELERRTAELEAGSERSASQRRAR
jgi:hypothetical protein